jgi:hypothetical protein
MKNWNRDTVNRVHFVHGIVISINHAVMSPCSESIPFGVHRLASSVKRSGDLWRPQGRHKLLMKILAVGQAEAFGEDLGGFVEADHIGAALFQQRIETGRMQEGQQGHLQQPEPKAGADEETGHAALQGRDAQFVDASLHLRWQGASIRSALEPRPAQKEAAVVGHIQAIMQGQVNALPLPELEILGQHLAPLLVLNLGMDGSIQNFHVDLAQEWDHVAGGPLRKTAKPVIKSAREVTAKKACQHCHCETCNVHGSFLPKIRR